jgi:hypothetical protein
LPPRNEPSRRKCAGCSSRQGLIPLGPHKLAMPAGTFRRVFRVGRFAVKLPRARRLGAGMRCNRWEREAWTIWRPRLGWSSLCPVLFADPLGLLVVMPWAGDAATNEEVKALEERIGLECKAFTDAEGKPSDYRVLNGKVVAVDYGLAHEDMVRERRAYYGRMTSS